MVARLWDMLAENLTERDWLDADDPDVALHFVTSDAHLPNRQVRPSNRKLRLFGCACCRRNWSLLSQDWATECVLVSEAYADGLVGDDAAKATFLKAPESLLGLGGWDVFYVAAAAAADGEDRSMWALIAARDLSAPDGGVNRDELPHQMQRACRPDKRDSVELAAQASLLRDIYGNPFCCKSFNPEWRTQTVLELAWQMYDSQDFYPMPILADAIQDAGCDSHDILNHLRGPGPHARGCWAVDLILGKN